MTNDQILNQHKKTPTQLLAELRRAVNEEDWGDYISEDDFVRLSETAPELPEEPKAFLFFRLCFLEGDEGVATTFEAHSRRMKRVMSDLWRYGHLLSDNNHLRLFGGNDKHKPCVEWAMTRDLGANLGRDVDSIRGPLSFEHEGLVFACLYPELIRRLSLLRADGLILAGYEAVNGFDEGAGWAYTVRIGCNDDDPWNPQLTLAKRAHGHYLSVPERAA